MNPELELLAEEVDLLREDLFAQYEADWMDEEDSDENHLREMR